MATCCGYGDAADHHFGAEKVAQEIRLYRRKGLRVTTRRLVEGLVSAGFSRGTLLDIGGGFGGLSLAMLDAGVDRATLVEASSAYLAAASQETARRGRSTSMQFVHGDFVEIAPRVPEATIVTLDRVVCCYPSYRPLLQHALQRASHGFALSYPRDRWFVRVAFWFENTVRRQRGNPFRAFVHSPSAIQHMIEAAGFRLQSRSRTVMWSADVFVKAPSSVRATSD